MKIFKTMKTVQKIVINFLTIIVFILSITGCQNRPSVRINIGYLPITANLPLFVAQEKGFFQKEGLKINLKKMGSSNETMNALIAGRIDMAGAIGFSTLISVESKTPNYFKLYSTGVETKDKFTAYLLVRKNSQIHSVNELKGKVIGTYSGLTQLLNLKLILGNFFDSETDVIIKQVATNMQIPALESGEFDALFTIDPYSTIALETGIGKPLIENPRYKYILSPFPTFATPVSNKFLNNNHIIVKKFIKAYNKALEYIDNNNQESKSILTKYTPLNESIALKCKDYLIQKLGDQDINSVQKFADILFNDSIISKKVNVKNMYISNFK